MGNYSYAAAKISCSAVADRTAVHNEGRAGGNKYTAAHSGILSGVVFNRIIRCGITICNRAVFHDEITAVKYRNTAAVADGTAVDTAFLNCTAIHLEGTAIYSDATAEVVVSGVIGECDFVIHIACGTA